MIFIEGIPHTPTTDPLNNVAQKVESDGSTNVNAVISSNPPIPEGSTAVNEEDFGTVASTAGTDSFFVITNGQTLTIQVFSGGSQAQTSGSVCELFFDVNGDLSVLVRVRTIWVSGASFSIGINQDFDGDGTARMVMRRRGYTASGREMEIAFQGFEETT